MTFQIQGEEDQIALASWWFSWVSYLVCVFMNSDDEDSFVKDLLLDVTSNYNTSFSPEKRGVKR